MNAVPTSSLRSISTRVWPASRSTVTAAVAVTTLAVAVGWLYSSVVPALVRQWAADDDYSHGFFVAPLALFFAWERRDALREASRRPHALGLVILAVSLLCYVAGQFGSELFLTRVSLIGVLAGLVLFIAGSEHFRILAFPLAFLLLMVPLPAIIFNRLAFPLQLFASRIGELVISASGVPVLREGNVLQLPGTMLEVAEACSGIRSLMSLLMLAIVLGYFTERRTGARVVIALAAIPIAVLANATRVAGTGLASYWISPAAADGFFHTFSGWLMFVVALAGLLAVHRTIELARVRRARAAEARC
jgi:exosortase